MKSESQVIAKLELTVNEFNRLAETVPQDAKNVPPETANQLCVAMGSLIAIGWVLDCEDEIKALMAKINLAAGIDRLPQTPAAPTA